MAGRKITSNARIHGTKVKGNINHQVNYKGAADNDVEFAPEIQYNEVIGNINADINYRKVEPKNVGVTLVERSFQQPVVLIISLLFVIFAAFWIAQNDKDGEIISTLKKWLKKYIGIQE